MGSTCRKTQTRVFVAPAPSPRFPFAFRDHFFLRPSPSGALPIHPYISTHGQHISPGPGACAPVEARRCQAGEKENRAEDQRRSSLDGNVERRRPDVVLSQRYHRQGTVSRREIDMWALGTPFVLAKASQAARRHRVKIGPCRDQGNGNKWFDPFCSIFLAVHHWTKGVTTS